MVHLVVTKGSIVGLRQLVTKTKEKQEKQHLSFHLTEMKQLLIGSLPFFSNAIIPISENIVALSLRQSSSSLSSIFGGDEFV